MDPARTRRVPPATRWLLPAAAACLLVYAGCKPGAFGPTKQYTQIDLAHGGTVTGVVHYAGHAPAPVAIDMAQDPVCAMSGDSMTDSIVVNKQGALANVVVSIQSGLGDKAYPITRAPVIIDQKGCRFVPHVSAAMAGQQVEFTNSDPTQHNVHMSPTQPGNNAFDISQGPGGGPVSRYFQSPEMMIPIRCNNHPWMHAYLSILPNPFFAVTGNDGSFTIRGLPPGTYTLTAAQEQLGKKSAVIRVQANGTVQQAFTF